MVIDFARNANAPPTSAIGKMSHLLQSGCSQEEMKRWLKEHVNELPDGMRESVAQEFGIVANANTRAPRPMSREEEQREFERIYNAQGSEAADRFMLSRGYKKKPTDNEIMGAVERGLDSAVNNAKAEAEKKKRLAEELEAIDKDSLGNKRERILEAIRRSGLKQ